MIETYLRVVVPVVLTVLMFGMGLQLVGADFMRLARFPKAVLAGVLGQLILLPSIAFLLVHLLSLPLGIAAGIVVLAACPGGIASNSYCFLARADVGLSVTLTALSSLLSLVSAPIIVALGLAIVQLNAPEFSLFPSIHLPLGATVEQLLLLVVLPLSSGMIVRRYAEHLALKSDRGFRIANVAGLLILLFGAFALGFDFLLTNFQVLAPALLALNLASMLGGYLLARAFGLGAKQRNTLTIELGIHNVGLGMLIALNLLQQPEWIVAPGVYSIVMMLTAFAFVAGLRFHRGRFHAEPVI